VKQGRDNTKTVVMATSIIGCRSPLGGADVQNPRLRTDIAEKYLLK
jgi:hypothetical protein